MPRAVGLILLCLLTFVLGLGRPAITDSDEAFYAEAGREMVVGGDWTTPHYNFEPRLQKPILFYWFIAATYSLAGVSEFGARLWSALAGVGLALVAAAVARRWFGSREGVLAGAIVATSFGVVPLARQSLPDMPLAFLVSLAIWAAIEAVTSDRRDGGHVRWLYIAAAASALGMLDKGPVAVALPMTAVVPLLWWRRRRGLPLHLPAGHTTMAAGLFVLIAAPWYLAVIREQGLDYARQFFIGENVERFATSANNHWRGWLYAPVVIAGLLPWSAFFLLWIRPVATWLRTRRPLTLTEARLVAWAAGPLAFFMISVGSQPRYILPCLVPLAVLLSRSIVERVAAGPRRGLEFAATLVSGAMVVLIGLLVWRAAAVLAAAGGPPVSMGPIVMTAVGLVLLVALLALPPRLAPLAIAAAASASLVVFQRGVVAQGRPEPVEIVAQALRGEAPDVEVCACGALGRALNFYSARKTEIANVTPENVTELRQFLEAGGRRLAVIDERALAPIESAVGRPLPRLASVTYLNTSVWQRGEILYNPDPGWVQRVLLIANR